MSDGVESSISRRIRQHLLSLSTEARDLYLDNQVTTLDTPPCPLTFYRKYVAPNKPVVIRGLIDHWSALEKWSPSYFREVIGSLEVTVAVTPNGYADAVTGDKFVMPEERRMTMSKFLDALDHTDHGGGDNCSDVFYIQKQNSNLTDEFTVIMKDVDNSLALGNEAFGQAPDAANFWMGDGRAVTSMHRDHYENLYCVVSGEKTFVLIPPTDLPFVPYGKYQAAVYKSKDDGKFEIVDDESIGMVPWIPVDPLKPDLKHYPLYAHARPLEVTVSAGETLYLPSLWFHHVRQSHECIAVNFWYDMEFDIKYNYYKFVENIKQSIC